MVCSQDWGWSGVRIWIWIWIAGCEHHREVAGRGEVDGRHVNVIVVGVSFCCCFSYCYFGL